jgi:hypothetical protein
VSHKSHIRFQAIPFAALICLSLSLPKDIPAALFWSATVYDPITGSGLDNGQPFPSLNTVPFAQYYGQTGAERRRLDRHLFRAEVAGTGKKTGCASCPARASLSSSGSTARRKPSSIRHGSRAILSGLVRREGSLSDRAIGERQPCAKEICLGLFYSPPSASRQLRKRRCRCRNRRRWHKRYLPALIRVKITEAYATLVGRDAYFWAWPTVNVYSRRRLRGARCEKSQRDRSEADHE